MEKREFENMLLIGLVHAKHQVIEAEPVICLWEKSRIIKEVENRSL